VEHRAGSKGCIFLGIDLDTIYGIVSSIGVKVSPVDRMSPRIAPEFPEVVSLDFNTLGLHHFPQVLFLVPLVQDDHVG
jgi:hypothetical protein